MSIPSIKLSESRFGSAFRNVADKIPARTVDSERAIKGIKWVGKHISSPENRLILGVTALMSQPFIDLHNRRVDDETRKTSAARTVAKIIAGTSTGVLVRYGAIKLIEKMAKVPEENKPLKKWETFFTPNIKNLTLEKLRHYKNALGTILALVVMIFTNFAIDAPLTKFLTNKFIDDVKKKDIKQKPETQTLPPKNEQLPVNSSTNLIKMKLEEQKQNLSNSNNTGGAA